MDESPYELAVDQALGRIDSNVNEDKRKTELTIAVCPFRSLIERGKLLWNLLQAHVEVDASVWTNRHRSFP